MYGAQRLLEGVLHSRRGAHIGRRGSWGAWSCCRASAKVGFEFSLAIIRTRSDPFETIVAASGVTADRNHLVHFTTCVSRKGGDKLTAKRPRQLTMVGAIRNVRKSTIVVVAVFQSEPYIPNGAKQNTPLHLHDFVTTRLGDYL